MNQFLNNDSKLKKFDLNFTLSEDKEYSKIYCKIIYSNFKGVL